MLRVMGLPPCRLIVRVKSSPLTDVSVLSVETPETPSRFTDCVTLPKAGSDTATRVAALRVESGSALRTSAAETTGTSVGVVVAGMEIIGLSPLPPPPPPQDARKREAATAASILVFMVVLPLGSARRAPGHCKPTWRIMRPAYSPSLGSYPMPDIRLFYSTGNPA